MGREDTYLLGHVNGFWLRIMITLSPERVELPPDNLKSDRAIGSLEAMEMSPASLDGIGACLVVIIGLPRCFQLALVSLQHLLDIT